MLCNRSILHHHSDSLDFCYIFVVHFSIFVIIVKLTSYLLVYTFRAAATTAIHVVVVSNRITFKILHKIHWKQAYILKTIPPNQSAAEHAIQL